MTTEVKVTTDVSVAAHEMEKPTSTRRNIRGSSLLMGGRMISMVINYVVQVLIVRYLSTTDYGGFAYALSLVMLGETIVTLGLDRAITRFLPIYHEKEEYGKLFGTMMMVIGSIVVLGVSTILLVQVFQGMLIEQISDPQAVMLLTIMIVLSPVQAFDNILNGIFAVFSKPKAIFFQKYILGPALRLIVVVALIVAHSDVRFLAAGYVLSGIIGIVIFAAVLWHILREQGLIQRFKLAMVQIPFREVLAFTVPLLASDLVYVVMNTMDAVLLESSHGLDSVAAFRAVQPTARYNQFILTSFALLFTPIAARLFARDDREGINNLYWQNAVWVAIMSFPIFAATFSLAQPLTVTLFQERYAESGIIMALLSLGYYVNAATGQNGLALKVIGKLRYIVVIDIAAAVLNLLVNLTLIPRFGALGAAVGTTGTLILFNFMKQIGLRGTGIKVFDMSYARVYAVILLAAFGLLAVQTLFAPPFIVSFIIAALVSLAVLMLNRRELRLEQTFPELLRFAPVRWLLRV